LKLSDMTTHEQLLESELGDPDVRAEWERTTLARAVALQVVGYRGQHRLTQKALAERLGMKQPQVARLESGEHNPSIDTLARLAGVMEIEFNIDIRPHGRRSRLTTKRARTDAAVAMFESQEADVSLAAV
jgi:ribosome-binding protein aMBF1 (putative translation factor)